MGNEYLKLENLKVYKIAREFSRVIWEIFNKFFL